MLLASAGLLAGREAQATITVNVTVESDAGTSMPRPTAYQYWISYDDCIHDTILDFTVSWTENPVTMAASAVAQCSETFAFQPGDPQTDDCYLIKAGIQNGEVVQVSAQALVKNTLGIDCTTGVTPPANETIVWPQPITIYLYDPNDSTDSAVWPSASTSGGGLGGASSGGSTTQFDIALVGPQPPSPLGLSAGGEELFVELPATPTDVNTQGYYAFCYPPEAFSGGSTGAGGAGDAGGVDGGGGGAGGAPAGSDCPVGTTLPEVPSVSSKYLCAQIPSTATSYPIRKAAVVNGAPLEDGVQYVVAVAAYDQVFNLGPLAPLQCAAPEPTNTFFETYCADGGHGCAGGCGIRDVGGGTDPVWPVLSVGALAAVGIIVRRDRRRRAAV
jgi:hypothetical protein